MQIRLSLNWERKIYQLIFFLKHDVTNWKMIAREKANWKRYKAESRSWQFAIVVHKQMEIKT